MEEVEVEEDEVRIQTAGLGMSESSSFVGEEDVKDACETSITSVILPKQHQHHHPPHHHHHHEAVKEGGGDSNNNNNNNNVAIVVAEGQEDEDDGELENLQFT